MEMRWEETERGWWYVVEHDGMLKTGPFETKEKARSFFRNELDIELPEEPRLASKQFEIDRENQAVGPDFPEER